MPRNNSRRYCRLPLESTVFIELESPPPGGLGPGKVVRCQTLEVSRWGIRVQIDQRVTVGAILQIGVDIPGNDEPFYLVGQVRWRMQEQDKAGQLDRRFRDSQRRGFGSRALGEGAAGDGSQGRRLNFTSAAARFTSSSPASVLAGRSPLHFRTA